MRYLHTHKIQTYTPDRLFNSETPQARDFFTCGTKYFDAANSFKGFSRDFRAPTFGKKKGKKKATVRSCAVSDPESEEELEIRRPQSDVEDDAEDNEGKQATPFLKEMEINTNKGVAHNDDDDDDFANDVYMEDIPFEGLEEEGLYEDDATLDAIRNIVHNLAQIHDL